MISGIHHVQITIPPGSEHSARTFYCDILGLSEVKKPVELQARGGLWLQAGDKQVHVGIDSVSDRGRQRAHVAYEVHDLAALRKRLEDARVDVVELVRIPDLERFEARDPFGNRVEFIQRVR